MKNEFRIKIIKKCRVLSVIISLLLNCNLVYGNSEISLNNSEVDEISLEELSSDEIFSDNLNEEEFIIETSGLTSLAYDVNTDTIMYQYDMHEIMFPASITKIMTALLTIEYIEENNIGYYERVPMSHEAVFSLPYNSSNIAMDEGETLSVEDALYGLMVASANEVANALAEFVAGDNESFAKIMTARAKEIGAISTNFTNPHGLHDEEHYTTAYDMALIMQEAIKLPKFVEIISTSYYEIPPTEKQTEKRLLNNTHRMIRETNENFDERVIGGKTGFTTPAGTTLVTYANEEDKNLITVVMNSEGSKVYEDTRNLMDYAFDNYHVINLIEDEEFQDNITTLEERNYDILSKGNLGLTVPLDITKNDIKYNPVYDKETLNNLDGILSDDFLQETMMVGGNATPIQRVGELEILLGDKMLGNVVLVAKANLEEVVFEDEETNDTFMENMNRVFGFGNENVSDGYYLGLIVVGLLLFIVGVILTYLAYLKRKIRRKRIMHSHYVNNYKYK